MSKNETFNIRSGHMVVNKETGTVALSLSIAKEPISTPVGFVIDFKS